MIISKPLRHLLLALLPLPALAAPPQVYHAPIDRAAWHSDSDGAACHLSHEVPLFGTITFSRDGHGRSLATVVPARMPQPEVRTVLSARGTAWQPAPERELADVYIYPFGSLLRYDGAYVDALLAELEQGRSAVLRFERGFGDPVELVLTPVGFRAALRAHLQCAAGVATAVLDEL